MEEEKIEHRTLKEAKEDMKVAVIFTIFVSLIMIIGIFILVTFSVNLFTKLPTIDDEIVSVAVLLFGIIVLFLAAMGVMFMLLIIGYIYKEIKIFIKRKAKKS